MMTVTSIPTLIAEGTQMRGEITFSSGTTIFGVIEGEIIQQSLELLQVGKTGWVSGSIVSQGPVLVEGKVDGDIVSQTKISLLPSATVHGLLRAPSIEIRAGALYEGCHSTPRS